MKKLPKKLVIFIGILICIVLAGGIGWVVLRKVVLALPPSPATTGVSPTADGKFTLEELAKHNTKSDCYIAYQNEVFNITWFIPRHEGGDSIIQECGQVVDEFSKIHPGGPFTKRAVQTVLQASKVGMLTAQ